METQSGNVCLQMITLGSRCKTRCVAGGLYAKGTVANVTRESNGRWWGQGIFTELYGTFDSFYSIGGSATTFLSTSSQIGNVTRYDNKFRTRIRKLYSR